ncbi:hypothetical protein SNL152K_5996 [Streptomyces sp. NL15-2K]|nr:hypothetical protein SNL152K_5996 [Streptomyces sp. NL15-2K]
MAAQTVTACADHRSVAARTATQRPDRQHGVDSNDQGKRHEARRSCPL